ncbi:unnamed protein product, partial [Iphiclides podalirius]
MRVHSGGGAVASTITAFLRQSLSRAGPPRYRYGSLECRPPPAFPRTHQRRARSCLPHTSAAAVRQRSRANKSRLNALTI